MLLKLFRSGPVRGKYNRVGPGSGPVNLLFFDLVRAGAKDIRALRGRGVKNFVPQDSYLGRPTSFATIDLKLM